ncbi:MAG: divalent-cation tolerance protein CutA [Pseudomonadota bacterium]
MSTAIAVLSTCESRQQADDIAHQLVAENLAACVQIDSVDSVYRWQGEVESGPEYRLLIKTTAACYDGVEALIHKAHDYAVPQVLQLDISRGLPAYMEWLRDSVSPST